MAPISRTSWSVIAQSAALTLAGTCSGFVAPAMTDATEGLAASHAMASSRMVWPWSLA